ncbi:MAG: AI-2E family transporter YdiK [Enterobacteriaceae bacterium]
MNTTTGNLDLPRLIFSILFLTILLIACLWIVEPFILGFTWAVIVVIATWPLMLRLQGILWGKRTLAVLVMLLLLLLFFILPVIAAINTLVDNSGPLLAFATKPDKWQIPQLMWLQDIPLAGQSLHDGWLSLTANNGSLLLSKITPYIGQFSTWLVGKVANIGIFVLHCLLMLLFSAILYLYGETAARGIRRFALRVAHSKGESAMTIATQAIRSVALGVVVTALVQALLGGLGLMVSGIPHTTLLFILMFILCVAQLGPYLVLVPAIIWLYWSGDVTWGTLMAIWSVLVASLDSVLRPLLIKMGADLPLLLILFGVIGGLLAFGLLGIFIGPVVLAVSYRLLAAWMDEVKD